MNKNNKLTGNCDTSFDLELIALAQVHKNHTKNFEILNNKIIKLHYTIRKYSSSFLALFNCRLVGFAN